MCYEPKLIAPKSYQKSYQNLINLFLKFKKKNTLGF